MRNVPEVEFAIRRVLTDPVRLRFLLAGGMDDALDLRRFLVKIVPLARNALARLHALADRIPDDELRGLANSSLGEKGFHVAGAAILATFLPSGAREHYVQVVAPLEAIYDFLDSLCDRHTKRSPQAFRQLHEALFDALDPNRPLSAYYLYGPPGDDGDYLRALVLRVRRALSRLGDYELLVPHFARATQLYADVQCCSQLPADEREAACRRLAAEHAPQAGDLQWWEFCAAAGSQFHVYAPLYEAFCSEFSAVDTAYNAYFPNVCALHVLLDSFIDGLEDREHGDVNWIACYDSFDAFRERVQLFSARALLAFEDLGMPRAHRFVLRTMLLFYLTHPKVFAQGLNDAALQLLDVFPR